MPNTIPIWLVSPFLANKHTHENTQINTDSDLFNAPQKNLYSRPYTQRQIVWKKVKQSLFNTKYNSICIRTKVLYHTKMFLCNANADFIQI